MGLENLPHKSLPNGTLGISGGSVLGLHFGSILGVGGAFRAPFWKYFGGRWPPFWVYFGGLGAFWLPSASLGRNREHYPFPGARFWVQVGLPNRAKIDQKSMQKTIKNMMPFKIEF